MSTLDIRNPDSEEITEIQFDNSSDRIHKNLDSLRCGYTFLCYWHDFDNFIAACHKARELWGPKE